MRALLLFFWILTQFGCQPSSGEMAVLGNLEEVSDQAPQPLPPFNYLDSLSPCDGFDYPVGPPNAKGYYDAQPFGRNTHLGSDWNGNGGGNSDLGDPVFAIADGIVFYAEDAGPGWGNVVQVVHHAGTDSVPVFVESLYAHLDTIWVKEGSRIRRGQQIGTIGNANGTYWAHLHLEIRDSLGMEIGGGYSTETAGFVDPTQFIKAHRPKRK